MTLMRTPCLIKEDGKPNIMTQSYEELTENQKSLSRKQIDVLNIFGDRGDGGDGSVSITHPKA